MKTKVAGREFQEKTEIKNTYLVESELSQQTKRSITPKDKGCALCALPDPRCRDDLPEPWRVSLERSSTGSDSTSSHLSWLFQLILVAHTPESIATTTGREYILLNTTLPFLVGVDVQCHSSTGGTSFDLIYRFCQQQVRQLLCPIPTSKRNIDTHYTLLRLFANFSDNPFWFYLLCIRPHLLFFQGPHL